MVTGCWNIQSLNVEGTAGGGISINRLVADLAAERERQRIHRLLIEFAFLQSFRKTRNK